MRLVPILLSCLLLASCDPGSGPSAPQLPGAEPAQHEKFPGGGRILFGDAEGLQWAYPDGRVQVVAAGSFLGGELFPTGTRLLAWKIVRESYEYFVMDSDGSNRQHVAAPGAHSAVTLVRVSPDGTKVAYVRDWRGRASAPRTKLFVKDLVARTTTALGAFPPVTSEHDLSWSNDSRLLFRARRGRAVRSINSANGERGIYLRAQNRRLMRAFRRAWPDSPSPSRVVALGDTHDPRSPGFAVLLSAPGGRRAVAVLSDERTVAVPLRHAKPDITFEWISKHRFLLTTSRTIHQRNATFYVGTLRSAELSPLLNVRDLHAGPILGPQADELLFLKGRRPWRFLTLAPRSAAGPMKADGTGGYPWEWAP